MEIVYAGLIAVFLVGGALRACIFITIILLPKVDPSKLKFTCILLDCETHEIVLILLERASIVIRQLEGEALDIRDSVYCGPQEVG